MSQKVWDEKQRIEDTATPEHLIVVTPPSIVSADVASLDPPHARQCRHDDQMPPEPDLNIKIYKKNDSQESLQAPQTEDLTENIRILKHTHKGVKSSTLPRSGTPHGGSSYSLDERPLPSGLLVYPLLGKGSGHSGSLKPTKPKKKTTMMSFLDDSDDEDDMSDWTMWLPRPTRAHTISSGGTSNKQKVKEDYPDYIAEITAPLAKEEDFDFMIMPVVYGPEMGYKRNTGGKWDRKKTRKGNFMKVIRKLMGRKQTQEK